MKKQSGVSLTGLLFWCIVIALVAILGMRVAPSAIEYFKIKKDVKAAIKGLSADASVADVRKAYARYAEIDQISDLRPEDLDITKENGQVVISFAYDKRLSLFPGVALLIEYKGSSSD